MTYEDNDYTQYEQETESKPSHSNGASQTTQALKENLTNVKSRITNQATEIGQQLGQRIDQARTKTSETLQSTSRNIDKVANYLQDNNCEDMLESTKQMVSAHPGKSLLVFLGIGFLIGRAFK